MYKVVIVDDEDIIVRGLSQTLPWQKYNCQVVATASDGISAQKVIREHKPDILFTDISMPNLDGLKMIAAIKSEFLNLQISILSGYPDFEYAREAIQLGVVRYILKPSKFEELENALQQMVQNLQAQNDETKNPQPLKLEDNAQNFIIKNAITYIEENFDKKLTLSDVAEKVYVSQWHLSKLIAKNTKQSFSDILNGIRIEKAKQMLKDPCLKIWEISDKVGFADVTHFSRIFKKIEGISANEYRNSL